MKKVVAQLHMQYVKVKSMTGFCNLKVYEIYAIPESCKKLTIEGDGVGEDDNLFKSKLVQRTGIPQLAVLKSSYSNGELNLNTSPSFGGANVYPLKPHIRLSENIHTYTEINKKLKLVRW